MRKVRFWLIVAIAVTVACGAQAATTIWLTNDPGGAKVAGDAITVAPGATATLYCFVESDQIGNTYEIMVGYDRSTATTYGADKGTWVDGKLALLSGNTDIEASIPTYFDVLGSATLIASAREEDNTSLGGRPYGFRTIGATRTNGALGTMMCFSFQLRSQMTTVGDHQYVVVSNSAGGNSYSSAWKHGIALRESTYVLDIVTGQGPTHAVGASNKAVLDAIMTKAVPNYIWVLWGTVSQRTTDGFTIDDGSGVLINVIAPGNTVADNDYVAVRGGLDVSTKTLTSQGIKNYN